MFNPGSSAVLDSSEIIGKINASDVKSMESTQISLPNNSGGSRIYRRRSHLVERVPTPDTSTFRKKCMLKWDPWGVHWVCRLDAPMKNVCVCGCYLPKWVFFQQYDLIVPERENISLNFHRKCLPS